MSNQLFQGSERAYPFGRIIKYAAVTAMAAAVLFLSGFLSTSKASQKPVVGEEKPIALVNGMPIFPSDLSCAVEAWHFSSQHGATADVSGTLNRLIVIELLYQESLKHRFHGLVGDAEAVYRREVKFAGGEEKLRSTLSCNNITLQQFRQFIFRNLAINRLLDKIVYSRITVSDAEISGYYEAHKKEFKTPASVRLRQIFIKIPHTTDEKTLLDVKNKAREIFQQAIEGRDFVMLAKKYSDDPFAASIGGEMGVIYRGNLSHEFDSLIFNRVKGSVTEPVKSTGGYHIFQVVSTSPSIPKPLKEVRLRIITDIRRSKARKMISEYIEHLRKNADIRILDTKNGE